MMIYMCLAACLAAGEQRVDQRLVKALIQVESGGDDNARGDLKLRHKAYGCLQIRQPYADDSGLKIKAIACRGNRALSLKVFERYMARYATRKRLGREPTFEDIARIHNGGPDGWRNKSTLDYWKKVKAELAKQK